MTIVRCCLKNSATIPAVKDPYKMVNLHAGIERGHTHGSFHMAEVAGTLKDFQSYRLQAVITY